MCVTLEPSPAAGGRVTRPVRDRGGVGGLDGGTTCSGTCGARFPLLPAAAPPRQGRGQSACVPLNRTSAGVGGRCPFPVGPAQHSWCGPGVRGFLWGLHSTAGAALVCGGSCGGCTAQLVRPWRAGVAVGAAQHSWCGPGVRGFLWGLHSTAGAALACGGSCGACTALLVRPWRAGVPVGPAQHSWCGPGVRGCLWGLHSTAGAALACWGRGGGGAQE